MAGRTSFWLVMKYYEQRNGLKFCKRLKGVAFNQHLVMFPVVRFGGVVLVNLGTIFCKQVADTAEIQRFVRSVPDHQIILSGIWFFI